MQSISFSWYLEFELSGLQKKIRKFRSQKEKKWKKKKKKKKNSTNVSTVEIRFNSVSFVISFPLPHKMKYMDG